MSKSNGSAPAAPVISRSTTTNIAGSETTAGTVVNVFRFGDDKTPVSSEPAPVNDGAWSLSPDNPLTVGDMVYAEAYVKQPNGSLGPPSARSASHSVTDSGSADKPVITIYTGQYFAGLEETPGTLVNVVNVNNHLKSVMKSPVPVMNGAWSMVADNYPANAGDTVLAFAYLPGPDGVPTLASGASEPVTVDPGAVAPIPPEMDYVYLDGATVSGTTYPNTYVTLSVSGGSGGGAKFAPVFSADGDWSVDVGPGVASDATFSATANYPGGVASDAYVRALGHIEMGPLSISEVGSRQVIGVAPQPGQHILAWRSSDGKKIVDHTMSGIGTNFTAPYLKGMTLADGDLLNVVAALPEYGSMTPFSTAPEGFPG
ncbi:hypothetical protein [Martelella soudanensis]|uniref:hypothetical protein n=1 Tax=unclassified Martelella TaxID=2629616 RepID=UPI0015DE37A3|nr:MULTISPECIES: hypothetical protein [unclassified Martelella]